MEFGGPGFKSHSSQLFAATSKDSSVWIPYISVKAIAEMKSDTEQKIKLG